MTTQIDENWKRIAGLHVTEAGDIAVVWMAHDKLPDVIHLYDAAFFRQEPQPVVADGITCRGRWIPIAWNAKAKATAEWLRDKGCNLIDELKEDDALGEIHQREVDTRMRTQRMKVARTLANWQAEYKTFFRDGVKLPVDSHPLMAATRYAVAQLSWARRLRPKGAKPQRNYPRMAII